VTSVKSTMRKHGYVTGVVSGFVICVVRQIGLTCVLTAIRKHGRRSKRVYGRQRKMKQSRDQHKRRLAKLAKRAKRRVTARKSMEHENLVDAFIRRMSNRIASLRPRRGK